MDKAIVRARFKDYRRQIAYLKQRVADAEQSLEDANYYQEEALSRANRRADACRRECAERERQEQSDRWYREDELRRATKDLERARSYGDSWGEDRALKKLKSIY